MSQSTDNSPVNSLQPDDPATLSLDEIRVAISNIDTQLLQQLARRRELSRAVVLNKLGNFKPVRDQQREQQLLDSLIDKGSQLNLAPHFVTRLFHTIIEDSVTLQQQFLQQYANPEQWQEIGKKIAILGGRGAYSYLAANQYFSFANNEFIGFDSFEQVLGSVQENATDFAVIPIENTTSGGINEVYDLLLHADLAVVGEVNQPIEHCLLARESVKLEQIKLVLAHPEANRQCGQMLRTLPNAEIRLVSSTAEALKQAGLDSSGTVAAVGGEKSGQLFELLPLAKNIADQKGNATRFLVVAREPQVVSPQVNSKISVIVSTGQKPGALAEVLLVFRDAGLTLTKLESRPITGKPWEQMFYIDFEGNIDDPNVVQTLEDIRDICHFTKLLGCYPSAQVKPTRVSPTGYYGN